MRDTSQVFKFCFIKGPWSTIGTGIFLGSFFHYWSWKKRLMLEDLCNHEDKTYYKAQEKSLAYLKAGDDLEKHYIINFLKNEHNV